MHRVLVLPAEPWHVICEFVTRTEVTKSHQTAPMAASPVFPSPEL